MEVSYTPSTLLQKYWHSLVNKMIEEIWRKYKNWLILWIRQLQTKQYSVLSYFIWLLFLSLRKKGRIWKVNICAKYPTLSTHAEQPGVPGVRMKALLFTSRNLEHASIGEPEDASAWFYGEKKKVQKFRLIWALQMLYLNGTSIRIPQMGWRKKLQTRNSMVIF